MPRSFSGGARRDGARSAPAPRALGSAPQLRRAAASVPLNLGEGRRRCRKDRIHLWRVAAGSAGEVLAGLRTAEAFGYLTPVSAAPALGLCDRVLAMLWRLTH